MDCDFSPSSPHLLPNGLFSPQNRISFELLALSGLLGFSTFKGGKMLIFQGFANSRIVREFPPFSFKVRIATLTRNQFGSNATWVRIPPSAPEAAPCRVLLFYFYGKLCKGLQGGIRTARARRFASRRAATVLRTVARARENPTVCAKYHYSISHWVVLFYRRFAKSPYFSYKHLPFILK